MSKSTDPSRMGGARQRAEIRSQAFINGRYVDAASGKTFDCVSPIDGRVTCACGGMRSQEDMNRAVVAARRRFRRRHVVGSRPCTARKTLIRFAQLIERHADELALLESLDMGKPVDDALTVDVAASVRCMNWTGEAIDKVYDEIAPTGRDELGPDHPRAAGRGGRDRALEFPAADGDRGRSRQRWRWAIRVVLKPSEKSPLTAIRIAELAMEAGIPPGVLNVVPGFGKARASRWPCTWTSTAWCSPAPRPLAST